jgi:hypothetical protein
MARITNNRIKYCDDVLREKINLLKQNVLQNNENVTEEDLLEAYRQDINNVRRIPNFVNNDHSSSSFIYSILIVIVLLITTPLLGNVLEYLIGLRCIVPNNYLIWEATRPISDCDFCRGLKKPLILQNLTREEFLPYAYSSQPIIIKNAIKNWPAKKLLNYTFLKDLYLSTPGSFQDDCQFLPFKSNFMTLSDVFLMSADRIQLKDGQMPWYVGWSNCHPQILAELRKLYPRPHFLPIGNIFVFPLFFRSVTK